MLCSNCGKNTAQAYFKRVEGKDVRLVLCSGCYRLLYPEGGDAFFNSFLGGVSKKKKACPACGTTLDDFRSTGLLGCADCYKAFREELTPTVRYIHGKIRHEGKESGTATEEKYDMVRELVRVREGLRERIQLAEEAGNAPLANLLRNELNHLTRSVRKEDDV